jgi:3-oxoacyl-[acyl-carrier-protein] synthase-3
VNFLFRGKRVTGLLAVLPGNERKFVDDMKEFDFPENKSLKLKAVMGYDRHRVVSDGTCVSDLCVFGLQHLFDRDLLAKDDFDALVLVTQSPDYFMPPTCNIIQGQLGLKTDLFCLDINQGCAGFLIGLIQAFLLLELETIRKVVLMNADVLSRKVCVKDKNSYPLIGDGASIVIVEKDADQPPVYGNLKMDGAGSQALIIPAGGFRTPSSLETAAIKDVGENNFRSQDDLCMDGTAVFNFVQREVPPMIQGLFQFAGVGDEDVDYYLFHQPNRFMLEKLADRMKVRRDKMPANIVENFGNSSGATVPINIAFNLGNRLRNRAYTVCLAGFGVGLTCSSMLLRLGHLDFCELIEYKH